MTDSGDLRDWESDIDTLALAVGEWATRTFPKGTDRSRIVHLRREVEELNAALIDTDRYGGRVAPVAVGAAIGDEIADCLMLLFHLCHAHGVTPSFAVAEKFKRVKGYTWDQPDAEGVSEHVREGGA